MKKTIAVLLALCILAGCFTACGKKEVVLDYEDVTIFEADLNKGENLVGKTVKFTVDKFVPDGAFGYTIQTGEHLNFCSSKNPGVKDGDVVSVKVTEVQSLLGSYIISFEKID